MTETPIPAQHPGKASSYQRPYTDLFRHEDRVQLTDYVSWREAEDPDFASTLIFSRQGPQAPKKLLIVLPSDPIGLVAYTLRETGDDVTLILPGEDDLETFPLYIGAFDGTLANPNAHEIDEDCPAGVFIEIAREYGPDAVYRVTGFRTDGQ